MPPLDELVNLSVPEYEMTFPSDIEIDDDLANRLSALFRELLEGERQSVAGADDARRNELRLFIEMRESELGDDGRIGWLFDKYIAYRNQNARKPACRKAACSQMGGSPVGVGGLAKRVG